MLKKSKNINTDTEPFSNQADPISPVSEKRKTIIGENISIKGDIQGNEDLIIAGSVKGTIDLEESHLTVVPTGQVEGEIQSDKVTISGRMTGNIKALGKVELTKEAEFNGEIKAKSISVEDGAYLKAVIELEGDKVASKPDKEPFTLVNAIDSKE